MNNIRALVAGMVLSTWISLAHAADSASALMRDAQLLADCTKALDSQCVIRLSDIEAYDRISSRGFDFAKAQSVMYASMRKSHVKYVELSISSPHEVFTLNGRQYAFVPYTWVTEVEGQDSELRAYFVGISRDHGSTWKFFDGAHVTSDNIRLIVPGYTNQVLPNSTGSRFK
ncbi:MAG TPA: hypothetical protein VMF03_00955 [Steroidobacteraceae bacterium]|nr:hypothetical protein [Steroidobacteraceae bacterium]